MAPSAPAAPITLGSAPDIRLGQRSRSVTPPVRFLEGLIRFGRFGMLAGPSVFYSLLPEGFQNPYSELKPPPDRPELLLHK